MRLIAALLIIAVPASAGPTVLSLRWNELQVVAEGENFREKVTVRTEPDGTRRVRGKLEAITDTSLILRNDRGKIAIERTAVHSVRLGRKRGNPFRMRIVGAALMFPMWFVGLHLGLSIPGGIPEGRWWRMSRTPQGLAASVALPVGIYWLTQRADRRAGSIIVELKRERENQP
ncbi:MAG: hypothetical protein F4Y47_07455 [Acidobacteriia bacterium]|nr:hypothetical protein [Terriglobia bacterium]MYG02008.1 hypothetical protein [Terriglobia bacterium]MYK11138.1 hypothetical protein [Terriglobia bacterium]